MPEGRVDKASGFPAMSDYDLVRAFINIEFYLDTNSDVKETALADSNFDAVKHFIENGWWEGRNPAPWFDVRRYREFHESVVNPKGNVFLEYLRNGMFEGRRVFPAGEGDFVAADDDEIIALFDVPFYLSQDEEVRRHAEKNPSFSPLEYFFASGFRRLRDPNSWFSMVDYYNLYPDVRHAGMNPFLHFLLYGRFEGRIPRVNLTRRIPVSEKAPTLLFVGHSAHPAGAEIMLRDIIEWYGNSTAYNLDILLLAGGPLAREYQKYGRTFVTTKEELQKDLSSTDFLRSSYDGIYLNTVASGIFSSVLAEKYGDGNTPVLLHIHEMADVLEEFREPLEAINPFVTRYIAASSNVRDDLTRLFGIDGARIDVVNSFVPLVTSDIGEITLNRTTARSILGVGESEFLVIGAGTVYDRKGPDLFIDSLRVAVRRGGGNVRGLWFGDGPDLERYRSLIENEGLSAKIRFVGFRGDTRKLLAAADLFFLSSREDPFPLVCLEAGQFCVPIMHFDGVTGIDKITKLGGGVSVPAFDIHAAARQILRLISDSSARLSMGFQIRNLVASEYQISNAMPKLYTMIREVCGLKPLLSIIVPNYNHENYLFQRLESIRTQTYRDFEVILLDDASKDGSREILKEYRRLDGRFRCDFNDHPSGSPFRQWERGIRQARGSFIWIAESDDYSENNFIEEVLPALYVENCLISYCKSIIIDEDDIQHPEALDLYLSKYGNAKFADNYRSEGYEEVRDSMASHCTVVNASAVIFETNALASAVASGKDFRMCGDWRIYLEILSKGGIAFTRNSTNYFRRHSLSAVNVHEGTDLYFSERARIFDYVVRTFRISPKVRDRMVLELEKEWTRFKHVPGKKKELARYFDDIPSFSKRSSISRRPPKIGFYVHGMLFSKGGIERQCALLTRELSRRGYECIIYCRVWGSGEPVYEVPRSVEIIPIFDEQDAESTSLNLKERLILDGIDVFIPMLSEKLFEHIIRAGRGLNLRIIASEHNDPWVIEQLWWSKRSRSMHLGYADSIQLLLPAFTSSLPKKLEKKIAIIPNGIAPTIYRKKLNNFDRNRFVVVGRLERQKRIDIAIRAFQYVRQQHPGVTLDIYGEGALRDELIKLRNSLGLQNYVTFRGITENIYKELSLSRALIFTSEFEGFGMAVAEAMLVGTPTVAFKSCNGPRDIIQDGRTGALCEWDETGHSIAMAAIGLLDDNVSYSQMVEACVIEGARFSIENVVDQWESLIWNVFQR